MLLMWSFKVKEHQIRTKSLQRKPALTIYSFSCVCLSWLIPELPGLKQGGSGVLVEIEETKLGGPGVLMEIDETKIGGKSKCGRGLVHAGLGVWVLGFYERRTERYVIR